MIVSESQIFGVEFIFSRESGFLWEITIATFYDTRNLITTPCGQFWTFFREGQ